MRKLGQFKICIRNYEYTSKIMSSLQKMLLSKIIETITKIKKVNNKYVIIFVAEMKKVTISGL